MDSPFVSVVIATYRREESLRKALISLAKQTYSNFEIVVVDDNNEQEWNRKVRDTVELFQQEFSNIKLRLVVNSTNKGSARARNIGIEEAKGKYICLVDGDDIVDKDYISSLYQVINKDGCAISVCGYLRFRDINELKDIIHNNNSYIENTDSYLKKVLYQKNQNLYSISAWGKMYSKEIFKNTKYPEGKIYEDIYVIADIMSQVEEVSIVDDNLYYYRNSDNSITNSSFGKGRMQVIDSCNQLINRVNKYYPNIIKGAYTFKYARTYESIMMILKDNKKNNYNNEYKVLNEYIKKYRLKIIFDKNTNISCKLSSFLSFFGNKISYFFYKKWKGWKNR